jgi:hypothetical protein
VRPDDRSRARFSAPQVTSLRTNRYRVEWTAFLDCVASRSLDDRMIGDRAAEFVPGRYTGLRRQSRRTRGFRATSIPHDKQTRVRRRWAWTRAVDNELDRHRREYRWRSVTQIWMPLVAIMKPQNRIGVVPRFEDLIPETTDFDHLLPEADRALARQARDEFAALGRELNREELRRALYPVFYESAREQIVAGVSHDEIRAELAMLADGQDDQLASLYREAYEDALAGRPPQV